MMMKARFKFYFTKEGSMEVIKTIALMLFISLGFCDFAWAISAPPGGSFAYDIYEIAVNDILQGPIGYVAGVGFIALGAVNAGRNNIMAAIPCILGGGALLRANSIVETLGAII